MNAFRWAMRHGAVILFVTALLLFATSFSSYFFLSGEAFNQALSASGMTQSKFVLFWSALAQALNYAVWPFLGACLLYRVDRHWKDDRA